MKLNMFLRVFVLYVLGLFDRYSASCLELPKVGKASQAHCEHLEAEVSVAVPPLEKCWIACAPSTSFRYWAANLWDKNRQSEDNNQKH